MIRPIVRAIKILENPKKSLKGISKHKHFYAENGSVCANGLLALSTGLKLSASGDFFIDKEGQMQSVRRTNREVLGLTDEEITTINNLNPKADTFKGVAKLLRKEYNIPKIKK